MTLTLDPARTALLVMDMQADILAMLGDAAASAALVARIAPVIAAARAAGVPVIYVVIGFRPGYPELSPRSASFKMVTASGRFVVDVPGADIPAAIAPAAGDIVIVKHRVSAFYGTDLDLILRTRGVETLVLAGIATSGIVLSTIRHAADADYQCVVVRDGCADRDDEVHRVLLDKVFARHQVVAAAEVVAALTAPAAPRAGG